jgi:hypothetical protein
MENLPNRELENQEVLTCPHGADPAECEACWLEKQPAWQTIEKLQKGGPFERSDRHSADCTIESEGKKFRIEVIEKGEDPEIKNVHRLFLKTFGKEEIDPQKVTREAVDGYSPDWNTHFPKYRIVTVKDERGRLASVFTGAQLDVLDENGKPTGEAVFSVGYAVTAETKRQKGLAREAYISALIDAAKQAKDEGKTLKFAIGECTYTSEKFWNNVGWKRIYAQTKDKKNYAELKYMQPALDFDEETGKPTEDADECPEHLMIDSFGRNPPNTEEVKRSYEALLHYNGDWPESAFESSKAHQTHIKYMTGFKTKFKRFLDDHPQLIYLDAENREKARQQGIKIKEHTAADRGETGKEDF